MFNKETSLNQNKLLSSNNVIILKELNTVEPTLVAVSKLKPADDIITAYEAGQKHFGENYVNELAEKASDPKILEQCKEIRWHYIGHLQGNKVNKIVKTTNLFVIETVDSEKIASALDVGWMKNIKDENSRLKILVQVNTSKEEGNIINPTVQHLVVLILYGHLNHSYTFLVCKHDLHLNTLLFFLIKNR